MISDDWHLKQYTEIGDIAVTADGFLVAANLAYQGPGPARNLLLFSEDGTSWEVHRAVSDLVSMEALGDEIVALDDAGIVYFWNPT